jgi:putative membrane protein
MQDRDWEFLKNREEDRSFISSAFSWVGSVTPRIMPRVLAALVYSIAVKIAFYLDPRIGLEIAPFEYSGAALGMLLVFRLNAGHDRWWEARKLWGGIVNQSRNLALGAWAYGKGDEWKHLFLRWVAVYPHVMCSSLRGERDPSRFSRLVGQEEAEQIVRFNHMPSYVAGRLMFLLKIATHKEGITGFEFLSMEDQRGELINHIGACERILRTPMPVVIAIEARRFILAFLALLPFALAPEVGWLTPLVTVLVAHPLFCLDQIGIELQNPFHQSNLSHLPIDEICERIEANVLEYGNQMALPKTLSEIG